MDVATIQAKARADLVLEGAGGGSDVFLWEHSLRVAENARTIAGLREAQLLGVDGDAAYLAALYHDAAWARRVRSGEIDRSAVLLAPVTQGDCDVSARLLASSMAELVSPAVVRKATEGVRNQMDRTTRSAEAIVLAEAEALDEFGVLPIWMAARRGAVEGRGVAAAIEGWVRKREYRYWRAMLEDAFRFEAVRRVASERLSRFERLLDEVQLEHGGADLVAEIQRFPAWSPELPR